MNAAAPRTTLRLIADDLTGALDTAAEFVGLAGPIPAYWSGAVPADLPPSAALDTGTRELGRDRAIAVTAGLARCLEGGDIAYKKVDSLLRGHTMAELATCLQVGPWNACIVAPAFPYQGRKTRGGVQFRDGSNGEQVPVADLAGLLAAEGVAARLAQAGAGVAAGVTIFDAETDADLRKIATAGRKAAGPVLWCGSAGLAQALAHEAASPASSSLRTPVLGLFGSDQAVTAAQLAACGRHWLRLVDGGAQSAALVGEQLERMQVALASMALPSGLSRGDAAERISREMDRLLRRMRRPGTLMVAGGETLRALCLSLGAEALEVHGQVEPGVPRSTLRGGIWDGVDVISKSGAFGRRNLLRDLLHINAIRDERAET